MPELVAHRGDAARFPENTLPALAGALRAGVRWLECDIQLAADRVPVLMHDADLLRTGGDPRSVFELEAAALADASVHEPARFADTYLPTPVPGLDAAVELIARYPAATLFVEIKQESIDRFGLEVVCGQVREACEPAADRCVLISFNDRAVARVARAGLRTGWVIASWNSEVRHVAGRLAPEFLFVNVKRVPRGEPLWPGPWRWVAYDAKSADDALAIAARGFELVETRNPAGLLADPRIAAWSRA